MSERIFSNIKSAWLFLIVAAFFGAACRSPQKTEVRKLVPADTLVYLETNNVAAALESLAASPAFQTLAADKVDFSAFENVQTAIAVTGFETSEEDAVLSLKPQFVAVAETHAWSWQTVSLVENQLDRLIRKTYGETAKREASDKNGGRFFTWTASDNRRVFAFVRESLIYFGSDAAAIEKCLAVKSGAAESLAQNEFFNRVYSGENLTFGYVSNDGVKKIAALAGISLAVGASEESNERSFIAQTVPQILQNTTQEIIWTANRTEGGIEDKYSVVLTGENASALRETLDSDPDSPSDFKDYLPSDIFSTTRYNLQNPLDAWRGSLALTAKNTDAWRRKILIGFSGKMLESYGISDAETFLSAVNAPLTTALFDAEGTKSITIAAVGDADKLKSSISRTIDFKKSPEKISNAEVWFSDDRNLAAAFVESRLILGDGESVLKCLRAKPNEHNPAFQRFVESRTVAATFGTDIDSAEKIVGLLANAKSADRKLATFYTTETRLTESGFERVTVSDFGLIGAILKNLN